LNESYAFFTKTEKSLMAATEKDILVDVCGGHGLISMFFLAHRKVRAYPRTEPYRARVGGADHGSNLNTAHHRTTRQREEATRGVQGLDAAEPSVVCPEEARRHSVRTRSRRTGLGWPRAPSCGEEGGLAPTVCPWEL